MTCGHALLPTQAAMCDFCLGRKPFSGHRELMIWIGWGRAVPQGKLFPDLLKRAVDETD